MKIIKQKDLQLIFQAEINETLANAIRRYLNKIPLFAISEVEIHKNDSPLYDETIAHRLGLIPIKFDKTINQKNPAILKLKSSNEGMVYSEGLKGNVDVAFDKIPITLLNKGQELELITNIELGKGSEHSKFSPGTMFYRNISEIIADKQFKDEIKKSCPNIEIKEKGDKIIILDDKDKEILDVCEGICDAKNKKAEINIKPGLIITLESFGQLGKKEIFNESISYLKKDLLEISKKLS